MHLLFISKNIHHNATFSKWMSLTLCRKKVFTHNSSSFSVRHVNGIFVSWNLAKQACKISKRKNNIYLVISASCPGNKKKVRNITGYRNVFNLDPFATNFDFDSLLKCCQIRNYKSMKHTDDSLAGRHVFFFISFLY